MPTDVPPWNPDLPLHHQLYQHLRNGLADGMWSGPAGFPGEEELSRTLGVSVITVRKALERLKAEGWIVRGRGRGTQVVQRPEPPPVHSLGLLDQFIRSHDVTEHRLLSNGLEEAPVEACSVFGIPIGSELWVNRRLRLADGRPHSVTQAVQWPEIGSANTESELNSLDMVTIIRKRRGITPVRLRRTLSVGTAPLGVAGHLDVHFGDPVLVYTTTHYDADERVIIWARVHFREDASRFEETQILDDAAGKGTIKPFQKRVSTQEQTPPKRVRRGKTAK